MRLNFIKFVLEQIDFEKSAIVPKNEGGGNWTIKNINKFKTLIDTLEPVEIFNEEIREIKSTELYGTSQDSLLVPYEKEQQLFAKADYLVKASASLVRVSKKLIPPSLEESISIKLPEPSDFESLIKSMSMLQTAVSQVVINDEIEGSVKITHWEYGTFWVELFLGTQAAVALIASIGWSAAVVAKKINENKILEQHVRSLEIKNDSLNDILEGQKKLTNHLIEQEAQAISSQHFTKSDGENLERVKLAINSFAFLIQKGAEIHPALSAPEKVQNLFPKFDQLGSITSQIKQLEETTN